ncbi:DNA polymerase III subunit delta' [uncultured Desulfuromonas sp.]|uniref:DNA polymerase III subunit delta' n=1 Tax=uncultured Desulfuromonas sp. TaxID=181013 RepID=UPI002AAB402D|nr:DNA polymerase III subunit delta' [uncultured Desulfuromonas sp.]
MTFANIIGHDRQKKLLRQAWNNQRMAHAYLFTGAEGIGKRLMATAVVRLIFCEHQTGCGTCPGCRRIDHNNHPDLHILEPEGSFIKIDAIRELQKELQHPPLEAPRRICLIDGADKMNPAAGNALLKTLEEPRHDVMLILISAHPEAVLETIRSRCQQLPFARLDQAMIAKVLKQQEFSDDECRILASLSEGSLKKALGSDREFYLEQRKALFKAVCTLSPGSVVPMLELAEKWAADKDQLEDLGTVLLSCYRDVFLVVSQGSSSLLANTDLKDRIVHQAARESLSSIQHKLDALLEFQHHLRRNVNRQLAVERLLIRLVQPKAAL